MNKEEGEKVFAPSSLFFPGYLFLLLTFDPKHSDLHPLTGNLLDRVPFLIGQAKD